MSNLKGVLDHKGNWFQCNMEKCEAYNVKYSDYIKRLDHNWSEEDALTNPNDLKNTVYFDHDYVMYHTQKAMLEAHDITRTLYVSRKTKGWPLKKVLTTPSAERIAEEEARNRDLILKEEERLHSFLRKLITTFIKNGDPAKEDDLVKFIMPLLCGELTEKMKDDINLVDLMANFGNIKKVTVTCTGKSPRKSGAIAQEATDHKGNVYLNRKVMCNTYNIPENRFKSRINRSKWPLSYALEIPLEQEFFPDHLGNEYKGLHMMLRKYSIPKEIFQSRMDAGWSLKNSLTTPA